MKKANQYFIGGCISFAVTNIITIIMHLSNKEYTVNINSEIFLILIISLINLILYFMEDLPVKSQVMHMILELIITIVVAFIIGILTKIIDIESSRSAVTSVIIIAIVYGITTSSIYIDSKNDADEINKKLLGK